MQVGVLRGALVALLAIGLLIAPAPQPAQAQFGGITLSVDRGPGSTYAIGESIVVSYSLPQPGYTRLTSITPAGPRTVQEGYTPNTNGQVRTTVGDPAGRRTLRMELLQGNQVIAAGETYFNAVAAGGGTGGGGGVAAACNQTTNGQLAGLGDQNRYSFGASAGTRISATSGVVQIMIYPQPPTPSLRLTLVGPAGNPLNVGQDSLPETVAPQDGQYTIIVEVASLNGAQNRSFSYTLNLNCLGGSGGQTPPPPPGGITYQTGWNIVGGPGGSVFPVALFQFDPASNQYRTLGPGTPVQAGQGYWAYFNSPATVNLSGVSQSTASIVAPAMAWVQVANPSLLTTATVSGADAVYTWDPIGNQYGTGNLLRPGQGAWAIRYTPGTIIVSAP